MKIGFDAKRAFENTTGLGNYSRSLIASLAKKFPQYQYTLFAPKQTNLFSINDFSNTQIVLPQSILHKNFPSLWRRSSIVKDINKSNIDIFHGLSNELPSGINKGKPKSIITVHDLIFERYPETYHFDQKYTHRWKMKNSCKIADAVIAASHQTKQDLIDYYKIDASKIFVCYQSCNSIFEKEGSEENKQAIKRKYNLPNQYFLFVSSITKRKNLITVCKALALMKNELSIPLVIIGDGKKEKQEIKKYITDNSLQHLVIFLNESKAATTQDFINANDFPAIYQQALALVYPSIFEGFGIPLLEALKSNIPLISSNTSSLPEVAGDAALYFSPLDFVSLAHHLLSISTDTELRNNLKAIGQKRALLFTPQSHAESVMNVYKSII